MIINHTSSTDTEPNEELGAKYVSNIIITGKEGLGNAVGTLFRLELILPFQKDVILSKEGRTCRVTSGNWEAEKCLDCDL